MQAIRPCCESDKHIKNFRIHVWYFFSGSKYAGQKTGGIKEDKKSLINIHSELSAMNDIIPFLTYYER